MFIWISKTTGPYLKDGRLADVMALIQVLALDKFVERSEKGIRDELHMTPSSGGPDSKWASVAEEHPEFFRTRSGETFEMSLIARRVLPKNEENKRRLSPEFVGQLLNSAVELHDRQVRRSERWTYLIPIWVALIVGVFSLVGIGLKSISGG